MSGRDDYWFPAKRFGWGWGMPRSPQGWVVLFVYAVAIALMVVLVPPAAHLAGFLAGTLLVTVLLVAVCWWKGEPPRWRW
ncbi:MAG TPA: hypothetical protein VGC55_07260 [Dokdonella sp.]